MFQASPTPEDPADISILFEALFEETVGDPNEVFVVPIEGPQPESPPPCPPDVTLYDMLPEIVRNLDYDGALKAVVDAAEEEFCEVRGLAFQLTQLFDPDQAPDQTLPHLAAQLGIVDFDGSQQKMVLRQQIKNAVAMFKAAGTIPALQVALLFMGWEAEVVELYEIDADPGGQEPHALEDGPGLRPDSDIYLWVRPLIRGIQLDTTTATKIRARAATVLPAHVEIASLGRFERAEDAFELGDELTLNFTTPFTMSDTIGMVDGFAIELTSLLSDGIQMSDTLLVFSQTGASAPQWGSATWNAFIWGGTTTTIVNV